MGLFETMHINADGMEDYCKRFALLCVCLFVSVGSCCCLFVCLFVWGPVVVCCLLCLLHSLTPIQFLGTRSVGFACVLEPSSCIANYSIVVYVEHVQGSASVSFPSTLDIVIYCLALPCFLY